MAQVNIVIQKEDGHKLHISTDIERIPNKGEQIVFYKSYINSNKCFLLSVTSVRFYTGETIKPPRILTEVLDDNFKDQD